MKQIVQLGKENIVALLEDIVVNYTNISIKQNDFTVVLLKDTRTHTYSIEYDDKYGYFMLYKVYKGNKKYVGYMLDSKDLFITINGVIRKWGS